MDVDYMLSIVGKYVPMDVHMYIYTQLAHTLWDTTERVTRAKKKNQEF